MSTPKTHEPEFKELASIVRELIEVVEDHTKAIERLATWVEQQTDLRDWPQELSVEISRLSGLNQRISSMCKRLGAGDV